MVTSGAVKSLAELGKEAAVSVKYSMSESSLEVTICDVRSIPTPALGESETAVRLVSVLLVRVAVRTGSEPKSMEMPTPKVTEQPQHSERREEGKVVKGIGMMFDGGEEASELISNEWRLRFHTEVAATEPDMPLTVVGQDQASSSAHKAKVLASESMWLATRHAPQLLTEVPVSTDGGAPTEQSARIKSGVSNRESATKRCLASHLLPVASRHPLSDLAAHSTVPTERPRHGCSR